VPAGRWLVVGRVLAAGRVRCELCHVPADLRPQYLLAPTRFRFPALAALAGALPHGQGRESAVALLLVARVAASALEESVVPAGSVKRAEAARSWLPATCPDRQVRSATVALCDAVVAGEPRGIRRAMAKVMEVTAPILSPAARSELAPLAKAVAP
jgi:hypothetical protein